MQDTNKRNINIESSTDFVSLSRNILLCASKGLSRKKFRSEVLEIIKKEHKYLEVIILTGYGSMDSAVECTKLGAFSYLPKPYELGKLIEILQ